MTSPVTGVLPPQVSGPFSDLVTGAVFYTVCIDGSHSWSPSYSPDRLTFAWSDAFGGVGQLPSYAFLVTTAQLAGATTTPVTLALSDPDEATTRTVTVDVGSNAPVNPTLVLARPAGCSYSTDAGATWTTFSNGSGQPVVPIRQPATGPLAVFPSGALQSPTATLYTFPAAPSAFSVNPARPERWLIGLVNGDVWRTIDSGATWTLLKTFGGRIAQAFEAPDGLVLYVAVATTIWTSRLAFQDAPVVWASFPQPAQAISLLLGRWGNYAGASNGTVLNVDSDTVLAGPTTAIVGMAYNPRHGTLWVSELGGKFWRMAQGASTLTNLSTIPGGGGPIAPITPIPGAILVGNDSGTYLSPDAGLTWRLLLGGPTGTAGYSSPPVPGTY